MTIDHDIGNTVVMPRTKDRDASIDFGERVTRAMFAANLTPNQLHRRLVIELGDDDAPSAQHVRNMLGGKADPNVVDQTLLAGLAIVLDIALSELGPIAERRLGKVLALVGGIPPTDGGSTQQLSGGACTRYGQELAPVVQILAKVAA